MTAGPQAILIVEDNPTARKMFRVTLEVEGYRVLEAADGRSALACLARELPALVLQDLVLPDQDGFELARTIRAVPGCADLPIVVMSGFPRLLDRARNEPGCFNASLVKPVAPSLLIDVVRRYTTASRATTDTFGRGKTILIVDDDPVQLKLARLRFCDVGFEVEVALDGPSAIARATASPPDVVVCDVLMAERMATSSASRSARCQRWRPSRSCSYRRTMAAARTRRLRVRPAPTRSSRAAPR